MTNKKTLGYKYLDFIDIIYWINLDRSYDRKKQMEELLSNFNIKNERISAVDGKNMKFEDNSGGFKYIDNKQTEKCSNYEYACLLSHLNTILKFSQSNYNYALICEDDISLDFAKYWDKPISQIVKEAPSDWEIIMLFSTFYQTVNNDFTLKTPSVSIYGAGAYLISKTAANKLINRIYKNNKFILLPNLSCQSDNYIFYLLTTYSYKYPYFVSKLTNDSTIHPENLENHKKSYAQAVKNWESKNKKFIENWNSQNKYFTVNNIIFIIFIILIILIIRKALKIA
jgi:GR25 family glycosyltransferase involved in LPS biosynthesis